MFSIRAFPLSPTLNRPQARKTINEIRKYLRTYKQYLVPGISSELPFPSGSFDYVISSMLINNFRPDSPTPSNEKRAMKLIRLTLLDSVRVLKPKGQALHVFSMHGGGREFTDQILIPAEMANLRPDMNIQTSLKGPTQLAIEYQDTNGGHRSLDTELKQMWTVTAEHK